MVISEYEIFTVKAPEGQSPFQISSSVDFYNIHLGLEDKFAFNFFLLKQILTFKLLNFLLLNNCCILEAILEKTFSFKVGVTYSYINDMLPLIIKSVNIVIVNT